jgi:hypothetical protein
MKSLTIITGTAVVAAGLALAASSTAAPSTPPSAADVIAQLTAVGNRVIVNKTGAQPLDSCTVSQVRPGQTFTHFDRGLPGANHASTQVISMTVYVDVSC